MLSSRFFKLAVVDFGLEKHFWRHVQEKRLISRSCRWFLVTFKPRRCYFWCESWEKKGPNLAFTMGYLRFHVSNFTRKSLKRQQILKYRQKKMLHFIYGRFLCGRSQMGQTLQNFKAILFHFLHGNLHFNRSYRFQSLNTLGFSNISLQFGLKNPKTRLNLNFDTFNQRLDKIPNPFRANLCHQCH